MNPGNSYKFPKTYWYSLSLLLGYIHYIICCPTWVIETYIWVLNYNYKSWFWCLVNVYIMCEYIKKHVYVICIFLRLIKSKVTYALHIYLFYCAFNSFYQVSYVGLIIYLFNQWHDYRFAWFLTINQWQLSLLEY